MDPPSLKDALSTIDNSLESKSKGSKESSYGILDILIYSGISFACYKAITSEHADLYTSPETKEKGDGYGKYYYSGKGKDTDSIETLLDKLIILSNTGKNTVKWRRCLIYSVLATSFIVALKEENIPRGKDFLLIMLPIFGFFYSSFNFYEHHYDKYCREYTHYNLDQVRMKITDLSYRKLSDKKNK